MNNIEWLTDGNINMPDFDRKLISDWLIRVAREHGMLMGDVSYTFCDDAKIIEVNREFLDHDYYTDIITFDSSARGIIRGDIYISLDTVKSNSQLFNTPYRDELMRVIVHGILHLCGIDDKGPGQRAVMEEEENKALSYHPDRLQ